MSGPYQIDDSLALDFPSSTHYSYSLMVVQGNQTLRYRVLESVVSIHTCTFTSGGVSTDAMRCEQNLLPLSVRSVHPVTLLEDLAHVAVGVLLGSVLFQLGTTYHVQLHRSERPPTISIQLRPFSVTSYLE
jgi:hypothetical protein